MPIYIDLSVLREAQEIIKTTHSTFCQDCGIVDPPEGFYPMRIMGPDSLSEYLCIPCEKKRRGIKEVQP